MRLATFKHISSKNHDYGAAERYLLFQHDEFTMKPSLDEHGRLIPRDDYRIITLNCGEDDFAIACYRANLRYEKNNLRSDVKSHHYIISFDPRDTADNGLTIDTAQQLGEQFCRDHFAGHQAIVVTHPDGHNGSGNIHVHIVINSLRIKDVPRLPYMDRPADMKAGCKHRCTDTAMKFFKSEVMQMCQTHGLYQIDLLNGSKTRITECEYWAKRKGQAALDKAKPADSENGNAELPTKFETDKDKLRRIIKNALTTATNYTAFATLLLQEGFTVKESRGRLSYLTPDRTKPITARRLGDDFDRDAVLAVLGENAKDAVRVSTPPKQPLVYAEYGFSSAEELDTARNAAHDEVFELNQHRKQLDAAITEKKTLQQHIINFRDTRPIMDAYRALKPRKQPAYLDEHRVSISRHDAVIAYFDAHGMDKKLPTVKTLQAQIDELVSERNDVLALYREKENRVKELDTIYSDIHKAIHKAPELRKEQDER